jgi:hypothetical protein
MAQADSRRHRGSRPDYKAPKLSHAEALDRPAVLLVCALVTIKHTGG